MHGDLSQGRRAPWWPLGLAAAALTAFYFATRWQPLAHEELLWWFELARRFAEDGRFHTLSGEPWADHPPVYGLLLAAVFRVLGVGEGSARILGLGFGLLTLLLFHWAVRLVRDRHVPALPALVALALYVLHPVVLQAPLLLEPDAVLGPAAFLLFAVGALRTGLFSTRHGAVVGGLLLLPVLWTKLYHAVPLLAALAITLVASEGCRRGAQRLAALLAVGLTTFSATWLLLSRLAGTDPGRSFVYVLTRALGPGAGDPTGRWAALPKDGLQIVLWLSPALVVAAHLVAVRAWRRPAWPPALVFLAIWGVLHVDLFLVGIGPLYGFPRYHVPIVPVLLLVGVAALAESSRPAREAGGALALGVGSGLALALLIGDPLLALRVGLKEQALRADGDLATAILGLGAGLVGLLALPVLLLTASRAWAGRRAALGLLAAHASVASALVLAQASADYATRYAYGEARLAEAVALIRDGAAPGTVIAPLPVTRRLGAPPLLVSDGFWAGESDALVRAVASPETTVLAYSLAHHSLAQLRYLEGLAPRLERVGFARRRIGTFVVWWRSRADGWTR